MIAVAVVVVTVTAAIGFSFRESLAATPTMWLGLVIPYVALSALAFRRFWDRDTLRDSFSLRGGNLTVGFLTALLGFGAIWLVKKQLLPFGSPQSAWLFRLYLQIGDPQADKLIPIYAATLGVLEEVVWRGLVLQALTERWGVRRAVPIATVLYALAHVPTMVTLADPVAGPNPLLVAASLGIGLGWTFLAARMQRLTAVIASHATLGYFLTSPLGWL